MEKEYLLFDQFSKQALQTLHRFRAVMFSPTIYPKNRS